MTLRWNKNKKRKGREWKAHKKPTDSVFGTFLSGKFNLLSFKHFSVILLLLQYMILITWRALKWIFKRRMKKVLASFRFQSKCYKIQVDIIGLTIMWQCSFVYLTKHNILQNYKLVDDESLFSDSQFLLLLLLSVDLLMVLAACCSWWWWWWRYKWIICWLVRKFDVVQKSSGNII